MGYSEICLLHRLGLFFGFRILNFTIFWAGFVGVCVGGGGLSKFSVPCFYWGGVGKG